MKRYFILFLLIFMFGCAGVKVPKGYKLTMKEKLVIGTTCAIVALGGFGLGVNLTEKRTRERMEGMRQ